jgi:hypothetical protein
MPGRFSLPSLPLRENGEPRVARTLISSVQLNQPIPRRSGGIREQTHRVGHHPLANRLPLGLDHFRSISSLHILTIPFVSEIVKRSATIAARLKDRGKVPNNEACYRTRMPQVLLQGLFFVPLEDPPGKYPAVCSVEPGARPVGTRQAGHLITDRAQDCVRHTDIRLRVGNGKRRILLERAARRANGLDQQIRNDQNRITPHETKREQPAAIQTAVPCRAHLGLGPRSRPSPASDDAILA